MRLILIKLAGFKSFVDATTIPTPSQLVGVVGPNGCGKSNIIDAVRWVLGESKASELRGESMQDVIFNGSGQRKPAARASVELVFDNTQGRASGQWSSYAEVSVRRVLTRDGGSSYFINNQAVRRRDVHDIFLGTGLGARGYAIIGQGMINRLIEAKPEELRVFLEEAAGVSRYKERRRETENRLKDTRENLLRVEDIQQELEQQLLKLQGQAQVAQQYQQLQQEGELKQNLLWLVRESNAQCDQQARVLAIEQAHTQLESAMADLRSAQASLEATRQRHHQVNERVNQAQVDLFAAGSEVSSLEAEIRHVSDARNRMQMRREQLLTQAQEWQEQQEHCLLEIEQIQGQLEEAAYRTEELHQQSEIAQEGLPDIQERLRAQATRRDELRVELAKVEQSLALAAQAQRDADRHIQGLEVRLDRLLLEKKQLEEPDQANLARLHGELTVLQSQLEQAQQQMLLYEGQLPELEQRRRDEQQKQQQANTGVSRLEARLHALSKLQQDLQAQASLAPWLQKHGLENLQRLWQRLQIKKGWELALESVLRERMSALQLRQLDMAAAFVADAPPARLVFFQLPPSATSTSSASLNALSSLLPCTDPSLKSLIDAWLYNVFVSEDLPGAMALRDQLPPGAVVVVKEGHIVDKHSIRFFAPDSEQSGMLARQQEISHLQLEIKAAQLMADQQISASLGAEQALERVATALGPTRQRVSELTTRLHDIELELARQRQLAEQSGQRGRRLDEDIAEIQLQREELSASREEAEARFEALDAELAEHQERFAQAQLQGESLARDAEQARALLRERERAVQDAQFAERALQSRISELQRTMQLARDQSLRTQHELGSLQGELLELDASAAQAGLQQALETRAEREELLRLAKIELDNLTSDLRSFEQACGELEKALQPLRDQLTQLQLQEQASRMTVEQYAEQLDARQVDRAQLREILSEKTPEWQKSSWLQSEVQRVSRQIDALGPVNLAALEELHTAQERKTYLDSQHTDLNTAIDTLEDAIRKIDRETRQLLLETFDSVNQHFGELFPKLFGGGEAKLTLTGDEVLQAGVQVMAQPPGKRNSTIHLLSGGEKALTATALVFAFFKLNPAPFCLLDEVDAPLDDANTERYANLVASMSEQTQFLFISHNKIAMQMAKQLVGVTMQEQGVSRIVAVDVETALQMADL